jgi:hypothetical protein
MPGGTQVILTTTTGDTLVEQVDVNTPDRDIGRQQRKLEVKFRSLAVPVLGASRAESLLKAVCDLENCLDVAGIARLAVAEAAR